MELSSEARRALVVLATPVALTPGRNIQDATRDRELYRAAGSASWFATYGTDLPSYKPFGRRTIESLYSAGLVDLVYPNLDQPLDCIRITPAGRAALESSHD